MAMSSFIHIIVLLLFLSVVHGVDCFVLFLKYFYVCQSPHLIFFPQVLLIMFLPPEVLIAQPLDLHVFSPMYHP